MNLRYALIFAFAVLPTGSHCQTESGTVPAGTPLALTIDQHYPMRAGQSIKARLLYPIYADNKLLLPKDTVVAGSVVVLRSDHSRRVHALLGGDFTPFRIPEIKFTQIILADSTSAPLASSTATIGTPIYRAVAPPPAKGGFLHQQIDAGLTVARSDVAAFTAPGKGDRLLQLIYSQLPYHPQRIEKGTSWTIETLAPIEVSAQPAPSVPPSVPVRKPHFWEPQLPASQNPGADTPAWIVQANLTDALSSESSKTGQAIKAVVAEPIYDANHTLAVPQGATLVGAVTHAKPARMFGRTGTLSFSFSQLALPDAETQTVETRLTGADSAQDIALNSEGQAKSKPRDKISIPLLLVLMASRPLDQDHHDGGNGSPLGKNASGGAAGLGLIGTVVGLAGGSPYAAAGIGYWGAAQAFYSRWIARGQKISFAKDTRIVVEATPRHSAPIKPNVQPTP
jgi:hypothetical protein